jgi:hypothetical protein
MACGKEGNVKRSGKIKTLTSVFEVIITRYAKMLEQDVRVLYCFHPLQKEPEF